MKIIRIGRYGYGGEYGSTKLAEEKLGVKIQRNNENNILNIIELKTALKNWFSRYEGRSQSHDKDIFALQFEIYNQEYRSKLSTKAQKWISEKVTGPISSKIDEAIFDSSVFFSQTLPNFIDETILKNEAALMRKLGKPAIEACITKFKEACKKDGEKFSLAEYSGARDLLVHIGKPAVPGLMVLLGDKDPKVREEALHILGEIGDPVIINKAGMMLNDKTENRSVREAAFWMLRFSFIEKGGEAALKAIKTLSSYINSSAMAQKPFLNKDFDFTLHMQDINAIYPFEIADFIAHLMGENIDNSDKEIASIAKDSLNVYENSARQLSMKKSLEEERKESGKNIADRNKEAAKEFNAWLDKERSNSPDDRKNVIEELLNQLPQLAEIYREGEKKMSKPRDISSFHGIKLPSHKINLHGFKLPKSRWHSQF